MDVQQVQAAILDAANRYGLDPNLLLAQARQESGFNQGSRSSAGAIGVMQLMPGTARGLGVDPNNVLENIDGGARYMQQMLQRYNNSYPLALAAYNAGPGRVDRHLSQGVPLPSETQAYVPAIMGRGSAVPSSGPINVPQMNVAGAQPSPGVQPVNTAGVQAMNMAPGAQAQAPTGGVPISPSTPATAPPQAAAAGPEGLLNNAVDSELTKRLQAIPGLLASMNPKPPPPLQPLQQAVNPAYRQAQMQNPAMMALLRQQLMSGNALPGMGGGGLPGS